MNMYIFEKDQNALDWISCLIPERLYFGPYPNQLMVDQMITQHHFNIIVNLTCDNEEKEYILNDVNDVNDVNDEKESKYIKYIHFPIKDNEIPNCIHSYCNFIFFLKNEIENGNKIYIHCRGGHGRSSMVCVSVYMVIFMTDLKSSIEYVSKAHNERIVLREKWKKCKFPFNSKQYSFLSKIHKNIYISVKYYNKYYNWLYFYDFINYFKTTKNNKNDEDYSYFFIKKIKGNREFEFKLFLTYMKNFVLTDCLDKDITYAYEKGLKKSREILFYNN